MWKCWVLVGKWLLLPSQLGKYMFNALSLNGEIIKGHICIINTSTIKYASTENIPQIEAKYILKAEMLTLKYRL